MEELRPRPGIKVVEDGIDRIRHASDRVVGEIDGCRVDLCQGPAQPFTFALCRPSQGIQAHGHGSAEKRLDREVEVTVCIKQVAGRLGDTEVPEALVPWDRRRCGLSDEIPCCVPDLNGPRETDSEVSDRHVPENDAASLRPPNGMSRLGSLDREGRASLGRDEVEGLLGGADGVLNGRLIVRRPPRSRDNEVLAAGTRERRPAACDRPRDVGRQLAIEAKDTAGGASGLGSRLTTR